jgi:cobalt/nickel transport system permease protein
MTAPTTATSGALERLDDRMRVVTALVSVTAVAALQTPLALGLALAIALLLVGIAGCTPGELWQRFRHVEIVLAVLLLLVPVSVPGTPVFAAAGLTISLEGLERALILALKVHACLLLLFALVTGLEPVRLGRALAGLGAPARFVHLYLFVVRYLDLARLDVGRLHEAMRVRGFRPGPNRRTWQSLAQGAGAVLVRAIERAERIEEAMRCRGFAGRFPTPTARPLSGRDHAVGLAALSLVVALLVLDRWP